MAPGVGLILARKQREYLLVSVMEIEAQWNTAKCQPVVCFVCRATAPTVDGSRLRLAKVVFRE